jgi:hypothetical protein
MREFPPDCQCVLELIKLHREGLLDTARESHQLLVDRATKVVWEYRNNPALCSAIRPADIEPGFSVCFKYTRPDVNSPFRFGVVDPDPEKAFLSGCWKVFTFNIKKEKHKKKGQEVIVKAGPSWRSYRLEAMEDVRHVAAPALPATSAPRRTWPGWGRGSATCSGNCSARRRPALDKGGRG